MQKLITNYWRYVEKYNRKDRFMMENYSYAGDLIQGGDIAKKFEDLPTETQQEVLLKLLELKELNFTDWKTGFHDKYYVKGTNYNSIMDVYEYKGKRPINIDLYSYENRVLFRNLKCVFTIESFELNERQRRRLNMFSPNKV